MTRVLSIAGCSRRGQDLWFWGRGDECGLQCQEEARSQARRPRPFFTCLRNLPRRIIVMTSTTPIREESDHPASVIGTILEGKDIFIIDRKPRT